VSDPPQPASGDVRDFFAGALVAIGWLILSLAGLCTSAVVLIGVPMAISASGFSMDTLELLLVGGLYPLFIGGIPMAIGVGLIAVGRSIRRSGGAATPPAAGPDPNA
jgi:hypothetical protein